MPRIPKVGFVSLGCPRRWLIPSASSPHLRSEGYEVAPTYDKADVVVVNTCGFIDAAVDESLDAIGEALEQTVA
jgi:ribosomal protein S12 methylthiotransferase